MNLHTILTGTARKGYDLRNMERRDDTWIHWEVNFITSFGVRASCPCEVVTSSGDEDCSRLSENIIPTELLQNTTSTTKTAMDFPENFRAPPGIEDVD